MPEDELPRPEGESAPPSFDFDDDAISTLLDAFVETQTGPQSRRVSHPPNPDDAGAIAAQRTVFQDLSRHEALPLVGASTETKARRIDLLEALAERAVGSARARLLTAAAELHEQLGDVEAASADYRRAAAADARDVVVLRALRRIAIRDEDWTAAAEALEKEAALDLGGAERAAALKLLAQIQLSKLRDAAAAEQAAGHATELQEDDFVAWALMASARLARGQSDRAAEALAESAKRWPTSAAQAVILLHAAELMERSGAPHAAKALYARVLELRPGSLAAGLGMARAARELGTLEEATEALRAASEQASGSCSSALKRAAAATLGALGKDKDALSLLSAEQNTASLWTLSEIAARSGDLWRAVEALRVEPTDATPELRVTSDARRARLNAELGDADQRSETSNAIDDHPSLRAYVTASERLRSVRDQPGSGREAMIVPMVQDQQSIASQTARADEAARLTDGAGFIDALDRELEQLPESLATGAALAIAETAQTVDVSDRLTALLQAEDRVGAHPILTRALSLAGDDPQRCAARWSDEGKGADGDRAAFAFMMAATMMPGTVGATDACEAALGRRPDFWPALWLLEDDVESPKVRAKAAAAQASLDPEHAAAHLLRAAIWAPSAAERLTHANAALDRSLPDPLLIEHIVEATGDATEAAGDLLLLAARRLGPISYFLRAASSYRLAGLPSQAAKALREASAASPEDGVIRVWQKDAELQASEFARLTDAAMRQAREASDDVERLGALCSIAAVDRFARGDMQSARLSLQSIAEMRPGHVPTARALEWDALRERDLDRIRSSARRVLEALAPGSPDRLARHRLILELLRADSDILQSEIDRFLLGIDEGLVADPGLARQVLGAAYANGAPSLALNALASLQVALGHDLERGALALEAAHVLKKEGDTEGALQALGPARSHPLAVEEEARLLRAARRWEEAAAVYEEAARRAIDSQRAASLWREAAMIFEELDEPGRAVDAWAAAALCDVTYLDVYRRLATLYRSQGRQDALASLTESRIKAGADTPTLVSLLLDRAEQRRSRGDHDGVVETLHECLDLDPHHFTALRELVEAHRAMEQWPSAAEALVRIAHLNRSNEEQLWAFTQLAELYHEHLEDLPRAEASLRRAHELAPSHVETLDRLASVLSALGKHREAARLLDELVSRAGSDAQERDYRIRFAAAAEGAGLRRDAERVLENLRAEQPTEPDVILAVADYYERQGDERAEAMHLNRALNDVRAAIDAHPGDEALWTTLVRVVHRRHGRGPASCVASAAIALGHPALLFEGDVTPRGEAFGNPKLPLSSLVDSIVAPPGVPHTVRRLFALCEHAFDKVLPFDAGAWRLRKPSGEHGALVEEATAVAEALGIGEPRLKITYVAPAACMPITGEPPTLVVGGNLHDMTTPQERRFLFARALKVAGTHLAPALRARPEELDATLLALLRGREAARAHGAGGPQMHALQKKMLKAVPRRWRDEVESLVLELGGSTEFSTPSVPFAISELGDRAALTLTGDVPSAVNALLKISGHDVRAGDPGRVDAIRQTPEAWAVIRFAMSDAHFEARAQAGVDP